MSTKKRAWQKRSEQVATVLRNARIHQIYWIENKVLLALAAESQRDHFPVELHPKKMLEYAAAKKIWNTDPRYLTQQQQASGSGGDGDDVSGVYEADMPDVENFISEVESTARESHNAEKHDMTKRHEVSLRARGDMVVRIVDDSGTRESFYCVSGEWCTFSGSLPLHIVGDIQRTTKFRGADIPYIVAFQNDERGLGIWPEPIFSVRGRDFDRMLAENSQFPDPIRHRFVIDLFRDGVPLHDAPVAAASNSNEIDVLNPVMVTSRFALNRLSEQSERAVAIGASAREHEYASALDRSMNRDVLLARICAQQLSPLKMLRAPFPELALRLLMLNDSIVFVHRYYNNDIKVALSLVARGESNLPTDAPKSAIPAPVLATERLCQKECVRIVHLMLLHESHVLCFRPLRKRIADERHQPWLALLPDLSLESYKRVTESNVRGGAAPPIHVAIAVDIYHSIIVRDITEHKHMFSVFGAHEDDNKPEIYYQRGIKETIDTLRAPDTLGQHGRFALPPKGAPLTPQLRILLRNDRRRLSEGDQSCTSDEFAAGVHWLVDEKIVATQRIVGTGKYNKDFPVDIFQAADLHEEQTQLVALLIDIYRRGREQLNVMNDRLSEPVPHEFSAHFALLNMSRETWRTMYQPAVMENREKRFQLKVLAKSAAAVAPTPTPVSNDDESLDLLHQLAYAIAEFDDHARKRYESLRPTLHFNDFADAYADARANRQHRCPSLLLKSLPPAKLANGKSFAQEQIDCITTILSQSIVQVTGRGGVGKSELLTYLTRCYPQQIILTAFTGQVASELTRRTNTKAVTIHSLLFQHTRYREARVRASAYRRHAASKKQTSAAAGARTPEQFQLEDVLNCKDDYALRQYIEEHIGGAPPYTSPFPQGASILVIDEMSLVSFKLFYRLIRAAHCPAEGRFIAKLVLMGDLDQLPPIDFGNVQSDIAHGFPSSVCELVHNHRSSGTELFNLAQAIAEHREKLPLSKFDTFQADNALNAGDAIVAFRCEEADAEARIAYIYRTLKAFAKESQQIQQIQTIAATNIEINAANETIRWNLFGNDQMSRPETAVRLLQRLQPGAYADDEQDCVARQYAKEELATRVMVGDRIYLTRNQRIYYQPNSRDSEPREKLFFNARLLTAVQFYNTPATLTATMFCRCRMCPEKTADTPSDYVSPCMLRRDLVPPLRCGIDISSDTHLAYHTELTDWLQRDARRFGVFRDEAGDYIEFDVLKMLGRGAVPSKSGAVGKYGRGFAMTVHKQQGGQHKIIVYMCTRPSQTTTWRSVYTAITRAQLRCIIISTDSRFREFSMRVDPLRRSSMWHQLSIAIDKLHRGTHDRTITERWLDFEGRRYRTDTPRAPPLQAEPPHTPDESTEVMESDEQTAADQGPSGVPISDDFVFDRDDIDDDNNGKKRK